MTNAPIANMKLKTLLHQNFDYTMITKRLRTVSWSRDNHPTCVVNKPLFGIPTFPLAAKSNQKETHLEAKQKFIYRGMFETQKSGNKASSREIGLNLINVQVQQLDRIRCPEE